MHIRLPAQVFPDCLILMQKTAKKILENFASRPNILRLSFTKKRNRVYHDAVTESERRRDKNLNFQDVGFWHLIKEGFMVQGRSGHGAVTIGNKMYVFGGCVGKMPAELPRALNDIQAFDFENKTWTEISTFGKGPTGRAAFAMCNIPGTKKLVVAGGSGEVKLFGDIFEFDTETKIWRELYPDIDSSFCHFYGQSVCSFGDDLYFFGGSTGHVYTNATFRFHIPTQTWTEVRTTGVVPSPRFQHTATICGNCMLIIGGGKYAPISPFLDIYSLNLETLVWTFLSTKGISPIGRAAHSADYDPKTGLMFIGGGFDVSLERLNDYHILNLHDLRWKNIAIPSLYFVARAFHASCLYNGSLFVIGGSDCSTRLRDVWEYKYLISPSSLTSTAALVVFKNHNCEDTDELLNFWKCSLPLELITRYLS